MTKKQIGSEPIYDARALGTPRMLVLGLQHMFAMFGATVLVPALTGLNVAATLLFAGIGTLLFPSFDQAAKFPLSWGPSFAFIGGYQAIAPMLPEQGNQRPQHRASRPTPASASCWPARVRRARPRCSRPSAPRRSCASSRRSSPAPSSSPSA